MRNYADIGAYLSIYKAFTIIYNRTLHTHKKYIHISHRSTGLHHHSKSIDVPQQCHSHFDTIIKWISTL